jgi:hypothetical protein
MPIEPWNWLWTITTLVAWRAARSKTRFSPYLPPVVACSAVAAAVAWSGIGGSWHVILFPVFPLFLFGSTRLRFHSPLTQPSSAGSISVAYARPRKAERFRAARPARVRPERTRNTLFWEAVAWTPAAAVAIVLIAVGVDEPWAVAPVFPAAPFLAAGLWRWLAKVAATAGRDVRRLAAFAALELSLGVAGLVMPEPVPPIIDMNGTRPVAATTTTMPIDVIPIVADGEAGLHIEVVGSVARFDGNLDVVPIEGAFVTVKGAVGAVHFEITDASGHASFPVQPGSYTVFVVPPGNRWSVVRGCRDLLEQFPVAAGEQWTWRVPMVDGNAAIAYGAVTRCDAPEHPTPGKGF